MAFLFLLRASFVSHSQPQTDNNDKRDLRQSCYLLNCIVFYLIELRFHNTTLSITKTPNIMSTYVDATSGAVEHCQLMAQQHPDLAEDYYDKIASYCKQKLWHQLTLTVLDFVSQPSKTLRNTPEGTNSFLALYDKVVLSIDSKLNPLALSRIATQVATSLAPPMTADKATIEEKDVTAAKAILENLLANKAETLGTPAKIFVQSKLSLLTLNTMAQPSDSMPEEQRAKQQQQLASIKSIINTNAESLKEMIQAPDTAESAIVHSAHYEMAMTYYKVLGPPEAFYEQAMSYLNYAPLLDEPQQKEKADAGTTKYYHQLAVDLCLAALTGEGTWSRKPLKPSHTN